MTIGRVNLTNPYIGPRRFEQEESKFFFGRDEEVKILSGLVISHQLSLFYAQSGAGKSSLLRAGLLPRLTSKTRVGRGTDAYLYQTMQVLPIVTVGRGVPPSTDVAIKNIFSFSAQLDLLPTANPNKLADRSLVDSLALLLDDGIEQGATWEVAQEQDGRTRPRLIKPDASLLIIDQFEEIFTVHPERGREREAFFRQVNEALKRFPTLHILFTMREDYLAELTPYANLLIDDLRNRYRMERLRREGALLAVTQPALAGNPSRTFAPGVAKKLVDNLRRIQRSQRSQRLAPVAQTAADGAAQIDLAHGEYVEPVHLQIVCRDLWAALPAEREEIQESDLVNLGDVDQALINFYENTLKSVVGQTDVSERTLRRWFNEELITPARTKGLIYRDEGGETAGLTNAAVDLLNAAWLIRSDLRGGDTWYELAHDRLIEPILTANLSWQTSYENPVAAAFARWEDNKSPQLLLRGRDLVAAEAYVRQHPKEIAEDEKQYLTDSRRQWDGERRRQVVGIAVITIVLLLLAFAGWNAIETRNAKELAAQQAEEAARQKIEAARQETIARSRGLAIKSNQLLAAGQRESALTAAIAAGHAAETLEAFSAIRQAIEYPSGGIAQRMAHGSVIRDIAWDGDQRVASAGEDGRILIWDLAQSVAVGEWMTPAGIGPPFSVAWGRDGSHLTSGHSSGELIIWGNGAPPIIRKAHEDGVNSVAWHPNGRLLLTGGNDGFVRIWDGTTGDLLAADDIGVVVKKARWSPTGERFAIASGDGSFSIWSVDGNFQPTRAISPTAAYSPIMFGATDIDWSDRGEKLLTAGTSGIGADFLPTAHLWLTGGQQVPVLAFGGHTAFALSRAVFSPESRLIATAGEDMDIRIWNAQDGLLQKILRGHEGPVYSLLWLTEDSLLSAGNDGFVLRWNLATESELPSRMYSGQISLLDWLDEETILSASYDGSGHLWRAEDGEVLLTLEHPGGILNRRAYIQKKQLLTTGADGTVALWNLDGYTETVRIGVGIGRYNFARWERNFLIAGYECHHNICGEDRFEVHLWRAEKIFPGMSPPPDLILKGHSGIIQTARWNNTDGTRMVTTSDDGTIRLWDVNLESLTAGQPLQVLVHATSDISATLTHLNRGVREALWSRDDSALLSYSRDSNARLWRWDNVSGGFVVAFTMPHGSPVESAAWIENEQQIITTSVDGVRFWDAESGRLLRDILVGKVLWIDTEQMRVLATSDGTTAILWDLNVNTELRKFVGHTDNIVGALVDEDQRRLVTYDQTAVWLWDFASGEALATLSRGEEQIVKVDWNSSRRQVSIGWKDGAVRQFYWGMDDLLGSACRLNTQQDETTRSLCDVITQQ